jgi:hypothetical protein
MTNMIKVSRSTTVSETVEYPDGRKVRRSVWSNESSEVPEALLIEQLVKPVPLAIETVQIEAVEPPAPARVVTPIAERPNRALALALLGANDVKTGAS